LNLASVSLHCYYCTHDVRRTLRECYPDGPVRNQTIRKGEATI
jgi:hypothetical protein